MALVKPFWRASMSPPRRLVAGRTLNRLRERSVILLGDRNDEAHNFTVERPRFARRSPWRSPHQQTRRQVANA